MNELTIIEKDAIRENLKAYCEKYPSQNKASGSLKGVSAGTVSTILNGKYENISDEMFRNIASQVGTGAASSASGWQIVETGAFQEISFALEDAQRFRNVKWIVGDAGCGKTTAAKMYTQENREAFYVLCSEDMSKAEFTREIARTIGLRADGYNLRELWDLIIADLTQMEMPLMIFDEADKLTDTVFHYFISFYNRMEEKFGVNLKCGMVFLSTDYIKRRMHLGLRYNKKGYKEIASRIIGGSYFDLDPTTKNDVFAICVANGIKDRAKAAEVIESSEGNNFDLRVVKKSIHKVKRVNE